MTAVTNDELCRLVIQGPSSRIDLSIPVHIRLADLMPSLLHNLGQELADQGLEHSGWILQRLGEAPLDEDRTLAELDCLDGEVLHLRPRSSHIPPLDFDDLIDGISTGIAARNGLWTDRTTRWAGLTLGGAALVLAAAVALRPEAGRLPSIFAGVTAIVLLGLCMLGRRRPALALAGNLLGAGAVTIVMAALTVTSLSGEFRHGHQIIPETLLFLLILALSLAAAWTSKVKDVVGPVGTGIGLTGLLLAGLVLLHRGIGLEWTAASGVILIVCALIRLSVPLLSFKLAGLSLPPLPVSVSDMQTNIDPESSTKILAGARRTDHYMTAVYGGISIPAAVAASVLGTGALWPQVSLITVLGLAAVLSSRVMTSLWHRLSLCAPALAGGISAVIAHTAHASDTTRCITAGVLVLAAIGLAVAGQVYADRRATPMWGRAGDILQALLAASAIPILLSVLGVYSFIQHKVI